MTHWKLTITKTPLGNWHIEQFYAGVVVREKLYMYCTKREALKDFKINVAIN